MNEQGVRYVIVYRTARDWRFTVGTSDQIACGSLRLAGTSESFERASDEFTAMLRNHWGVGAPIAWQVIKADWWGADLAPGALAASGEVPGPTP